IDVALEAGDPLRVRDEHLEALRLQVGRHPVDERRGPRERRLEQDVVAVAQRAGAQLLLGQVGQHRVGELGALVHAQRDARVVERWAREMAVRLPEIDPDRYLVMRPPPALSKRPGQAWEQLLLPAAAARARAEAIYNPANLAPLGWPSNVVQIHDAVALRHPE